MNEFFQALMEPEIPFLRHTLIAGLLASMAFGVVGSYVVSRRISYLAGAIAHCVLGGIGGAFYLKYNWGWTWMDPMLGAVIVGLVAALVIGLVDLYASEKVDSVISALWVLGMAGGVLLAYKAQGQADLESYLFGNIQLIESADLWMIGLLDVVVLGVGLIFYNRFLAICFDSEFARLRGVRTDLYYLVLLCLTALTIVMMVKLAGIVLVIALLTLPVTAARGFVRHLWQMMILATLLCMFCFAGGLVVSFNYELPSGPVIAELAGLGYVFLVLVRKIWLKIRKQRRLNAES